MISSLRTAMATQSHSQKKASKRCDECDNSDDVAWNSRHKHRHAGLAAACRSRDVVLMLVMTSTGELPGDDSPMPPDPYDRNTSKRQWELQMQAWRSAVKHFVADAHRL